MTRRYYGRVVANINSTAKTIQLGFAPRRGSPLLQLGDDQVEACQVWAIESLAELQDAGYVLHFVDGEVK